MKHVWRSLSVAAMAMMVSGHVGSPNVFFTGKAGPYDVRVVVRPPEVVPGIARVTVHAPSDARRVSIRPVYWRAGSRGAPSADDTRRLPGQPNSFEGSLWLMARGAYSVDVIVEGDRGTSNVMVPVASVATGRLEMGVGMRVLLAALAALLLAGLVNIVHKGAGESLLGPGATIDAARRHHARRVAAVSLPVLALALFGGARWWGAVDRDYQRTIYRPSALALSLKEGELRVQATDTVWQPPGRPSALMQDHGKPMHLFLVRADDARAFAHLHPQPLDTTANPEFITTLPPLPGGLYHVYADVVHETGFERTLVGSIAIDTSLAALQAESTRPQAGTRPRAVSREHPPASGHPAERRKPGADPDDAWFFGDASTGKAVRLADSSTMELQVEPDGPVQAEREVMLRVTVREGGGKPATLEPYLGMGAHAVVSRVDGAVYIHLHSMGTVTQAAQEAFLARDRGDTTASGRLNASSHSMDGMAVIASNVIEFPYAFPKNGSYRVFVQVKRRGRILTGAFVIPVSKPSAGDR